MATVLIGGNTKIRGLDADSTLEFYIRVGSVLPLSVMPPFSVLLYVENRKSENVECSFDGTIKTNCTITDEGAVTCYIPADTFSVAGRLHMKLTTYNPNENFSDGTCDDKIVVDTGYRTY